MAGENPPRDSKHDEEQHHPSEKDRGDNSSKEGHRDAHGDRHDNRGRYGKYQQPKGYREHRWARGERLPREYYAAPYVVVNYRERGWREPPRGYHWVRVNNDVVLAAVATGIVLDVLLNQY